MWVLLYLLICLLPLVLIILVTAAIAGAAVRVYRSVARTIAEFKPFADKIAADARGLQDRSSSYAGRAEALAGTFEEISGRWAFITGVFAEAKESPVAKLAGLAGRFRS